MSLGAPAPVRYTHPFAVMADDLRQEWTNRSPYPPGETNFSIARTKRFIQDPRGLLYDSYERFGPMFTLRISHGKIVFMIGPAANHYVTVSNASNFTVRESGFRPLVDIVGDGIFMTDGDYHRDMRRMVLPALHQKSIATYIDIMVEETERALESLVSGRTVNVYDWARPLALRIAARTLFGFDPDSEQARVAEMTRVLEQMGTLPLMSGSLRGPFTPCARLMKNIRRLDSVLDAEIAERRAHGGGEGTDVMSLLIAARDEDGEPLSDVQVRDQVKTLLLAGRDATALTLAFLLHELARHPEVVERVVAEQEACMEGGRPSPQQLMSGELVELEMALDETLRMYPPVWVGPRRSTEAFEFEGLTAPGNAYVDFSSFTSHYLPEVFPEPERFKPERFTPEAKAARPKGAYVPFGGGSRTCIGMRFAQLQIRTIATLMLGRFKLELPPDFSLKLSLLPLLAPKEDVPVIVSERTARRDNVPVAAGI
jgi:cytochrome P450